MTVRAICLFMILSALASSAGLAGSTDPARWISYAISVDRRLIPQDLGGKYDDVLNDKALVPELRFVTKEELGKITEVPEAEYLGAYVRKPDTLNILFLRDKLDIDGNACDRRVLIHELVHFYQYHHELKANPNPAPLTAEEFANEEEEAYAVQNTWMYNMRGMNQLFYSAMHLAPGIWAYNCVTK